MRNRTRHQTMLKTKQRPLLPHQIKVNLLDTLILALTFPKASLGKYYDFGIQMKK